MKKLKPYLSAFRLRALLETQYRTAALGGIATQFFFGAVLCCFYTALFETGQSDVSLQDTISYVWLQQLMFRALLASEGELTEQIMTGAISYTLLRPVDQHTWWFFRTLAQKVVGVLMRLIPGLLLMLLLPPTYRLSPPQSPVAFIQFLFSAALGMVCVTQINLIVMGIVMKTLDSRGLSAMLNLIMMIFCGNIIPLTLFPSALQTLIRYQPFAQALDAPIRMYLNAQSLPVWSLNVLIQVIWIALLWCLSRTIWERHLRQIIVQGG